MWGRRDKWDRWDRWDRWVGGTGEMRGLWGERIGERRVNDIIFCSFAFYS